MVFRGYFSEKRRQKDIAYIWTKIHFPIKNVEWTYVSMPKFWQYSRWNLEMDE